MRCENCNAQIHNEQALFCPKCGHKLVRVRLQTPPLSEAGEGNDVLEKLEEPERTAEREELGETPGTEQMPEPEKPEEPERAAEVEELGKAVEPEEVPEPKKPEEPERTAEAGEPGKAVKPKEVTEPGETPEPEEAAVEPVRPFPSEKEGKPQKRKGGKASVILPIVLLVLGAGALTAVFLLSHGEQDERAQSGIPESSSAQPQDAAALSPSAPDSAPALDPGAAQASSVPAPAISSAPDAQPDSQAPAFETPETSEPDQEEAALEPVPAEPNPAEPAAQPDDSEYVFPQSSSAYLTDADLAGLDKETLRLARNEICARHGKMFRDAGLRAYFESKSWYSGTVEADAFDRLVNIYNEYEVANIELIKRYEAM